MSNQCRYGAGIWTHDLQNMILLPLPLDQGSRPKVRIFFCLRILLAPNLQAKEKADYRLQPK